MKKILIYLLLLANLSTGFAFALDAYPEAAADHNLVETELLVDQDHHYSSSESHLDDHSCHGAAHLLGLVSNQIIPLVTHRDENFSLLSQTPTLLYTAPLLRPPIV